MRRNADESSRELQRRLAAGRDHDAAVRLAADQERRDGLVTQFEAELGRTFALVHGKTGGDVGSPAEWRRVAGILVATVLDGRGEYSEGNADCMLDEDAPAGRPIPVLVVVRDKNRGMVTIGARATAERRLAPFGAPWPDLATGEHEWWLWVNWSRNRREDEMAGVGVPVHDRVRIPDEVARRWLLLRG